MAGTLGLTGIGGLVAAAGPASAAAVCIPTGFYRDGINLKAALVDPVGPVTENVDATGCNIGVYYGPGSTGQIQNAEIFGASYYGVVNNGGAVDIVGSSVHDIGDVPFSGDQHGVGIYFAYGQPNSGSIQNSTVSRYQKGGIVVNGGTAQVVNNTVTGLGPISYNAQNGIQFGYGATGTISGTQISDNDYTGCSNEAAAKTGCVPYVASGVLLYDVSPAQVEVSNNRYRNDQRNVYATPASEVVAHS